MSKTLTDRTLALSGIFQSAYLVDQVARHGMLPQAEFETCLSSLFEMSPPSTEAVYGSRFEIKRGIQILIDQMQGDEDKRNVYIMRYAVNLLQLERKLSKHPAMLKKIADELDGAAHQIKHFGLTHSNVIARLADIYSQTISTLTPRIMVSGEDNHLQRCVHCCLLGSAQPYYGASAAATDGSCCFSGKNSLPAPGSSSHKKRPPSGGLF